MAEVAGRALTAWRALNERQQAYLAAILAVDQAYEAYERGAWAAGGRRRPAAEWRWIAYNEASSSLLDRLRARGLVDAGTGATFEALDRRGLLTRRYCRDAVGLPILEVRLTAAGRAAVRAGTGTPGPERLPPGTLREWHWRALALAYATPDGVPQGDEGGGRYGGIGWHTWQRLRDYRAGPLVEEWPIDWRAPAHPAGVSTPVYRLFLTDAGQRFYVAHWAEYRARYPAVDAPSPLVKP
jgi:hypothetical protein